MEYKNYIATVEFDDEAGIFHGEVINTSDVITFQGTTPDELRQALADSVEDYLAFCKERGEEPERPFSGKFVLRIDPELHRRLTIRARQEHKSLNAHIVEILNVTNSGYIQIQPSDLFVLRGMTEEYVDLLSNLGIVNIEDLTELVPEDLYLQAKETNSKKKLVRKLPGRRLLENWIRDARAIRETLENQPT